MTLNALVRTPVILMLCATAVASACARVGELAATGQLSAATSQADTPTPSYQEASEITATPWPIATATGISLTQESAPTATLFPAVQTELRLATARAEDSDGPSLPTPTVAAQHVVVWGDTLTDIAATYGASLSALIALNQLSNPDRLEIGQIINLPPPPESITPNISILADARLPRSEAVGDFNIEAFVSAQPGMLKSISDSVATRRSDGSERRDTLSASQVLERVSLEFSVDPRILLVLLEYRAGLLSGSDIARAESALPLLSLAEKEASGLYAQLSWLADLLNHGYYGWKYRNRRTLVLVDETRYFIHPDLNAASVALQFLMSQISEASDWRFDVGEGGFSATYRRYFGDPFAGVTELIPEDLTQPTLTLPFPPGQVWLFTGGFHGGWGNGSAWAAVDFAPPREPGTPGYCYTSSHPITAIASGVIARLAEGLIVLDLDGDGKEATGWTILYLHIDAVDTLRAGQAIQTGHTLGYASCQGGFSTATHLHIARRFNGEWIPADCVQCPRNAQAPPFVMSNWRVIGLANQLYQGYMVNLVDNRSAVAEQGRTSPINEISW